MVRVIRDTGHDVASRETLRVLERVRRAFDAALQVDQSGDDGRCAEVNGDSVDGAVVGEVKEVRPGVQLSEREGK